MRNLMFGLVVFVFVGILGGAAAAQTDVTVTNPRSNPVLVRDVDNDARRPFQVQFSIGQATLPTVPAGKVFVIEYILGHDQGAVDHRLDASLPVSTVVVRARPDRH